MVGVGDGKKMFERNFPFSIFPHWWSHKTVEKERESSCSMKTDSDLLHRHHFSLASSNCTKPSEGRKEKKNRNTKKFFIKNFTISCELSTFIDGGKTELKLSWNFAMRLFNELASTLTSRAKSPGEELSTFLRCLWSSHSGAAGCTRQDYIVCLGVLVASTRRTIESVDGRRVNFKFYDL